MIQSSSSYQFVSRSSDRILLDDLTLGGFQCARRVITLEELAIESVARTRTMATPAIENFEDRSMESETGTTQGACTEIASMPSNAHLEVAALAMILGRCKKSIQRAVRRGELPQPFTFMGRHVWLAGKIVEHLQKLQDDALHQAGRRDRKIEEQKRGR